MSKATFVTIFVLTWVLPSLAQAQKEKGRLNIQIQPGGIVEGIPIKKGETEGSYYYNDNWYVGNITLDKGQLIIDKPLKYDIKNQLIEILFETDVKVLYLKHIDQFEWFDELLQKKVLFINAKNFQFEIKKQRSFAQVLVTGDMGLLSISDTKIIKANYNAALDVGDKNDKIIKEETLYFVHNKKATKVSRNKKQFFTTFGDLAEDVKKYMKTNRLNHQKAADLAKVLTYYNEISDN